jgi:hypothetical protein
MCEILDKDEKFHLTATKFRLEYEGYIDSKKLYDFIYKKINREETFIYVCLADNKTVALILLDKQPNWTKRDKFTYKDSVLGCNPETKSMEPKYYTIKKSIEDEIHSLKKYESYGYPPPSKRLSRKCLKCNQVKEFYNFSSQKTNCKLCESIPDDVAINAKIFKEKKKSSPELEYLDSAIALFESKFNKEIDLLKKEIAELRQANTKYLHLIVNSYTEKADKVETYDSGFTLICLGPANILANVKNTEVLLEFLPIDAVEVKAFDSKYIIYFGVHSNINKLIDKLHTINTIEFEVLRTIKVPLDVANKIMTTFVNGFINNDDVADNFSKLESKNEKIENANVRMCHKSMLNIANLFISNQLGDIFNS